MEERYLDPYLHLIDEAKNLRYEWKWGQELHILCDKEGYDHSQPLASFHDGDFLFIINSVLGTPPSQHIVETAMEIQIPYLIRTLDQFVEESFSGLEEVIEFAASKSIPYYIQMDGTVRFYIGHPIWEYVIPCVYIPTFPGEHQYMGLGKNLYDTVVAYEKAKETAKFIGGKLVGVDSENYHIRIEYYNFNNVYDILFDGNEYEVTINDKQYTATDAACLKEVIDTNKKELILEVPDPFEIEFVDGSYKVTCVGFEVLEIFFMDGYAYVDFGKQHSMDIPVNEFNAWLYYTLNNITEQLYIPKHIPKEAKVTSLIPLKVEYEGVEIFQRTVSKVSYVTAYMEGVDFDSMIRNTCQWMDEMKQKGCTKFTHAGWAWFQTGEGPDDGYYIIVHPDTHRTRKVTKRTCDETDIYSSVVDMDSL